MQLADSVTDTISNLATSLIAPKLPVISSSGAVTAKAASASSNTDSGFSFGNLLSTIGNIGTAGLQVYGAVQQAKYLSSVGIQPSGYQNGLPVYGSTPSGVTPSNPFSLPSGSALPSGVSPSIGFPYGGASFVTTQGNSITDFLSSKTGIYIMLGGSALMLMLYMMKSKGT